MISTDRENLVTYAGFLLGMAVSAFSLAKMGIHSPAGSFLPLFAWSLGTWTGYLYAHYSVTGEIIDKLEGDHGKIPGGKLPRTGKIIGTAIFVSGFVIGVDAVRTGNFSIILLGSTLFWTGYVIDHYSTTGELL